jgi:alpha-tubulin suppressor-like RCC1 family protein
LGDGTTVNRNAPVSLNFVGTITSIAAGGNHSMILKNDMTAYTFGLNTFGQLGDGTTVPKSTPISLMAGVAAITAGNSHSFVLVGTTPHAFGKNTFGQLCLGTTVDTFAPAATALTGIQQIAAGGDHTILLKTDGTMLSCGNNQYGQLGDGNTTTAPTAVAVLWCYFNCCWAYTLFSFIIKWNCFFFW